MTEAMNELFDEKETTTTTSKRALAGTATLTDFGTKYASQIFTIVGSDLETYKESFIKSQTDNAELDKLIATTFATIDNIDVALQAQVDLLKTLNNATLNGMLKSQQSKRSRARHNTMTKENYQSLVAAAIAERLIRQALGKSTTSSSSRTGTGRATALFTDDELAALALDQMSLRAEIRNVQSKQSVAKKTDGYEETDLWKLLVDIKAQLMDIRDPNFRPADHVSDVPVQIQTVTVEVDTTRIAIADLLKDVAIDKLTTKNAKALLVQISAMTIEWKPEDDAPIAEEDEFSEKDGTDNGHTDEE
jgi:hypothetical protein